MSALRNDMLLQLTLILALGHLGSAEDPIVIPPIVSDGIEVALLITPGAYINYAAYEPLGVAIQQASPFKLWIGLVGSFVGDLPTVTQSSTRIEETLDMMRQQGMNTSYIFLSGHSLGGVTMQQWIKENLESTAGMLLFASELSSFEDETTEDFPILQISGDLDGLEMVPEVEVFFRALEEQVAEDPNMMIKRPIIILTDVNHMHFASGAPPDAVIEQDLLSPLPENEAKALLALHINAFLTAHIDTAPEDQIQESQAMLQADYSSTQEILRSLAEMRELTSTSGTGWPYSPWAETAQQIISDFSPESYGLLSVNDTNYEDFGAFELSKPSVELGETQGIVHTTSIVTDYLIGPIQEPVINPEELAIKLKSSEAVYAVLEPLGPTIMNSSPSCLTINEAVVEAALVSASEVVRDRYYNRANPFLLVDDLALETGSQWVDSKVYYNLTNSGLLVQSTSLTTTLDAPLGLDGMYYCKLMPPVRAIEYLLVDALRRTEP